MDRDGLLEVLERDGLLLLSDAALPSITSLVVGSAIHGSWWGHARGGEIYRLLNALAERPDVLMMKLVSGKVTFVHRRLWPAVVAVGQAREPWQMAGLSDHAVLLLRLVDEEGLLAWDDVPPLFPAHDRTLPRAARDLERRVLIHATEAHTPSGAHAKNLETWTTWAANTATRPPFPGVAEARLALETTLADLNDRCAARGRLPWQ